MTVLTTIQAAYTVVVTERQQRELNRIYREAELALDHPVKLHDWLDNHSAQHVVGQPESAMGCLLGTYLLAKTGALWNVSQERFWRYDLAPELAWQLPTWAVILQQRELRMGIPLTAELALGLLRRVVPNLAIAALVAASDEEDA